MALTYKASHTIQKEFLMKAIIASLILVMSVQAFARDHRENRDRAERASEQRRRNEERRREEERRRREGRVVLDIFDISNTLILSSWTFEEKQEAAQVLNDSQEYLQSGTISVLLNQKINEILINDQDLSLEDALDLIVESVKTKL